MPATSKTDLLLANAKPVSDSGSASVLTYIRRGKKTMPLELQRGVRICERNNSVGTKVSEEEAGGGAPGARATCGEVHGEAGVPL